MYNTIYKGFIYWPECFGQPFFYMAFACCVNAYMVSVHTSST